MASYHTALSLDWNDIFFVSSKGEHHSKIFVLWYLYQRDPAAFLPFLKDYVG